MGQQTPKILTPEYYQRLKQLEDHHPWTAAMRQMALDLLAVYWEDAPETLLLDAGCGTGLFLHEVESRFTKATALGCDLSTDGLTFAKSRGVPRLALANVAELPFRDGSVDVVTCSDVIQHLSQKEVDAVLGEFHRLVRHGGILLLRAAARRGIGKKKHRDDADYQQWEPEKLSAVVERHHFQVVFTALVNWLPSLWSDLRDSLRPVPQGDQGLALQPLSPQSWRSRLLAGYWRIERDLVLKAGWRPPGGHTIFCLARKL